MYRTITQINNIDSEFFSSLKTKDSVESGMTYNKLVGVTSIPKSLKMDYSRILDKPFLLTTTTWSTSDAVGELYRLALPSAIYNNYLAKVPFDSSTLYQMRMCLMIQVSGTPMHQGLLLCASVPNGSQVVSNVNSILCAPHCFMNANEATPICLEVPFYANSTLLRTSGSTNII